MAREVVEKVIGGLAYKVTLLGSKAGRAMSVRILKLLGPTLAGFVEGTIGKRDGAGAIALGASEAMREIALRLNEPELASIMDELAKFTTVAIDDKREPRLSDIFDDHFAGHYDWMMSWAAFAFEVNFRSFFAGAGIAALAAKLMSLVEALPSPPASTGTSTVSRPAGDTAQA